MLPAATAYVPAVHQDSLPQQQLALKTAEMDESRNFRELVAPYQYDLDLLLKAEELAQTLVCITPNLELQKRMMATHMSFTRTIIEGNKKLDRREENLRKLAIKTEESKIERAQQRGEFKQRCEEHQMAMRKSEFAVVSHQLETCEMIESQTVYHRTAKIDTEAKVRIASEEKKELEKQRDSELATNQWLRQQNY